MNPSQPIQPTQPVAMARPNMIPPATPMSPLGAALPANLASGAVADVPDNNGTLDSLQANMPGNIASGVVSEVPEKLPEWNRPTNTSGGDGQKKQLLQKLMSNLLSKPGRSMHEIINGVKDAIGAYKNYAKEWDTLAGGAAGAVSPMVSGGMKAGASGIQKILQGIQQKKSDGSGGPGMSVGRPMTPSSMPPAPVMVAPSVVNATTNTNTPPPIQAAPDLIAGQPQTSSFNRPAPVNQLGVFGY